MTYDNDPPRLRLSGDASDPFVQALDEAHFELPDADQLKAVAAGLPLGVDADHVPNRRSHISIGRTRLRVKSLQAAALALAVAFGVGATMLLSESMPFVKHAAVTPVVPTEESGSRAPVVRPFPAARAPKAEEAPAVVPPSPPRSPAHATGSVPRRPPPSPVAERPNQADLPASDVDGPSPEAETALLGRAQQALRADPARALSLTDQHRRTYPAGALGQESHLIAIEALAALGRTGEARSSAARFRTRYPNSAYLRRLDRLLGEPEGVSPSSSGH